MKLREEIIEYAKVARQVNEAEANKMIEAFGSVYKDVVEDNDPLGRHSTDVYELHETLKKVSEGWVYNGGWSK